MKKHSADLKEAERIKTLDALYTTFGAVKGRGQTKQLLRDLLTESERIMLGRRILIARLLLLGETHRGVVARLGVGMDTVYRVQKWLDDQCPGYEEAVSAMQKQMAERKSRAPFSFTALRKKYPQHFLLWTIVEGLSEK